MSVTHPRLAIIETSTLLDALRVIDDGAIEICFVVDDNGLVLGTMTDGDIRRAILRGVPLDGSVAGLYNVNFVSVKSGTPNAAAIQLMINRRIKALPVLDAEGKLVAALDLPTLLQRHRRPNRALIMAGGRGTRLNDLTHAIPKPMLPIGDRPILERIVNHLVSHGIERLYISIHFMGEMIRDYFGDGSRFQCDIQYVKEETPLGSGGCLSILPDTQTEPLFVINGDLLTRVNVGQMLDFHQSRGFEATMGVRSWSVQVPYGIVETSDSRVRSLAEKPAITRTINTGIYVISPEIIQRLEPGKAFPITQIFDDALCGGRPIGAYSIEDEWVDIGQPQDYFENHDPLAT
jgi:dTDP-glucose pyrophosphorylase